MEFAKDYLKSMILDGTIRRAYMTFDRDFFEISGLVTDALCPVLAYFSGGRWVQHADGAES